MESEVSILFWTVLAIYAFACGGYCVHMADIKNYSQGWWFFGGLFFGVIALIAIAGLPVLGEPKHPGKVFVSGAEK